MQKHKTQKTRAWVQLGSLYIEDDINLPDECFDADGKIIPSDAAEFVEIWITDELKMEYGAFITGSSDDPRNQK